MEIYFSPSSLEKLINKDDKLRKKYGTKQTDLIRRRLDELEAAANLEELTKIPWLKVHPLKHNRAGQGSVNLDGAWRLIFIPKPNKQLPSGGLVLKAATAVELQEIVDYPPKS